MPSPAPLQSSHSQPSSVPAATTNWLATGHRMTDAGSACSATVDLDQPRQGITLGSEGVSSASTLLGLDLRSDCRLSDHWVRGDDVTAVYETADAPADARHLRTTAMWRQHPSDGATRAWELIASAQTSLLQSDSVLAVVSEIEATDILWGTCTDGVTHWHTNPSPEATCILLRRGEATDSNSTSVLVAAHPGDARRMTVRRDGKRVIVECWLFSTELEKGVLLRSRVLAAIGPAADATRWAGDLAVRFAVSPPVLTT
jgi:hypothetical protein